jgi:hypothetical protein
VGEGKVSAGTGVGDSADGPTVEGANGDGDGDGDSDDASGETPGATSGVGDSDGRVRDGDGEGVLAGNAEQPTIKTTSATTNPRVNPNSHLRLCAVMTSGAPGVCRELEPPS